MVSDLHIESVRESGGACNLLNLLICWKRSRVDETLIRIGYYEILSARRGGEDTQVPPLAPARARPGHAPGHEISAAYLLLFPVSRRLSALGSTRVVLAGLVQHI